TITPQLNPLLVSGGKGNYFFLNSNSSAKNMWFSCKVEKMLISATYFIHPIKIGSSNFTSRNFGYSK
ncbi:MAG: hypothetical protein IJD27_02610, partial [Alistipes sp.]|nr:hypothetical protein [Alistipes sp.]